MSVTPNPSLLDQLLTEFRGELYMMMVASWREGQAAGFEGHRIERALLEAALAENVEVAIETMGKAECASFISTVTNQKLVRAKDE